MKRKLFTIMAIGLISLFAVSCNCDREDQKSDESKTTEVTDTKADKKVASYTCEMKCEISDKPGKCSKCDMDMKEIKK